MNEEMIDKCLSGYDKNPLRKIYKRDQDAALKEHIHIYRDGVVCETDKRGFPTPENKSPLELMVNAPNGVIPLWAKGTTLKWRFQESSMAVFRDPEAAKGYLRKLFGLGVKLWGPGVPVSFSETHENWDFELVVASKENCGPSGCTLARAFFPDAGRHELVLFPTLFEQTHQEQVETMAHELGHIFGLRHFFADVSETAWPSTKFGKHSKFSIMNYGPNSRMTENDRADLAALYESFWDGSLEKINGTQVVAVHPFSATSTNQPPIQLAAMQSGLALDKTNNAGTGGSPPRGDSLSALHGFFSLFPTKRPF